MVKEYVVRPFIQGGTTSIHFSMKVTLLMKTGCCLSVIVIGVIGMVRYKTLQFSLFVHKVYRSVLRAQPLNKLSSLLSWQTIKTSSPYYVTHLVTHRKKAVNYLRPKNKVSPCEFSVWCSMPLWLYLLVQA